MLENNQKELILLEDLGYLKPKETSNYKKRYGLYKCFCGNEFTTVIQSVKRGLTQSCGCLGTNNKHNLANHRLYATWKQMNARCNNPKSKSYNDYGARGVKVCDEWHNMENFIKDMFSSYAEGLTIDRIDVDGDYEPNNCRWTSREIQQRNKRIYKNNKSGHNGVCWHKIANKWMVGIKVNNKKIHLGYFDNVQDGALAYDKYIIDNNLEHTKNFS